jgi:hypothetical protein
MCQGRCIRSSLHMLVVEQGAYIFVCWSGGIPVHICHSFNIRRTMLYGRRCVKVVETVEEDRVVHHLDVDSSDTSNVLGGLRTKFQCLC